MNNDLISREALRNVILNDRKLDGANANWEVNRILVHIDNAPTVTDRTEEVLSLQNTIAKLVEGIAENERPKGKWIKHDTWDYSCSICGISTSVDDGIAEDLPNFCPNCGTKMLKGGAE